MPSSEHAPEQLLSDILAYAEKADASVAARDMPALAGMDAMVDMLCQRVTALDAESAKTFAPHLEEVLARITIMQEKMVALQNEVKANLKSLSNTKKANQAYKNTPEA